MRSKQRSFLLRLQQGQVANPALQLEKQVMMCVVTRYDGSEG